jgi:hypothetical protein
MGATQVLGRKNRQAPPRDPDHQSARRLEKKNGGGSRDDV